MQRLLNFHTEDDVSDVSDLVRAWNTYLNFLQYILFLLSKKTLMLKFQCLIYAGPQPLPNVDCTFTCQRILICGCRPIFHISAKVQKGWYGPAPDRLFCRVSSWLGLYKAGEQNKLDQRGLQRVAPHQCWHLLDLVAGADRVQSKSWEKGFSVVLRGSYLISVTQKLWGNICNAKKCYRLPANLN